MPTPPPPAIVQAHDLEMHESEIAHARGICMRAEREGRLTHIILREPTITADGNLTASYRVVSAREAIDRCIQGEIDGDGEMGTTEVDR